MPHFTYSERTILILRERRETRYIDVDASGGLGPVYVALVRERHEQGDYQDITEEPKHEGPEPALVRVEDDPHGLYKAANDETMLLWKRCRRERFRVEEARAYLEKALAGDEKAARWIVESRRDYQYEGVDSEKLLVTIPLDT